MEHTDLDHGTELMSRAVSELSDAALDQATQLPGWTRRHLLAHLASNAEALIRLCSWAATGVESRMYSSPEQRASDIECGATAAPAILRQRIVSTAAELRTALESLDETSWTAEVMTAQGRTVPAAEIPWMRTREVWLHTVDLDAGVGVQDLPEQFCVRLVTEVAAWRDARGNGPALSIDTRNDRRGPGQGGPWQVRGTGPATSVRAPVTELAGWLTGRAALDGAPVLPAWL